MGQGLAARRVAQPAASSRERLGPGRWQAAARPAPGTQLAHSWHTALLRGSSTRSCTPPRQEEGRGLCPASGDVRWLSWQAVPVAQHCANLSSLASTWHGGVSGLWHWFLQERLGRAACSWLGRARHVPQDDGTAQHSPPAFQPSRAGSWVKHSTKMLKSRGDF